MRPDEIDPEELRSAVLAAASQQPAKHRWKAPWPFASWPQYGSERTYGDLAMVIDYAREEVIKEMEHARDPALRIGEGETDAIAFERIAAETRRRWLSDRRMVVLAKKWGEQTMVEAYRRKLAFDERWNQAFRLNTALPDNRTLRATLRMATGLEDPLP